MSHKLNAHQPLEKQEIVRISLTLHLKITEREIQKNCLIQQLPNTTRFQETKTFRTRLAPARI